jgi:hypothetical protein
MTKGVLSTSDNPFVSKTGVFLAHGLGLVGFFRAAWREGKCTRAQPPLMRCGRTHGERAYAGERPQHYTFFRVQKIN